MAYTDLVSSGVTLVADTATTYNFAFDTPIAADGSPHITHMGLQLDATMADNPTFDTPLSGLITSLRIKVGANIILDWNEPVANAGTKQVPQLGLLAQTLGGEDWLNEYDQTNFKFLSNLTFPMGLDASRSHRVNVTVALADVSTWGGNTAGLTAASSQMNVPVTYGTSTESTIIGSRQDFIISAGATRTTTIYGKDGWSMLGVLACTDSLSTDKFTEFRINNGAFRELKIDQWRALNGRFSGSFLTGVSVAASSNLGAIPVQYNYQPGVVFLNLRRITAGANIDMAVTNGESSDSTLSSFPVWVAPIGQKQSKAPRQTASTKDSTTATVENEAQYSNV